MKKNAATIYTICISLLLIGNSIQKCGFDPEKYKNIEIQKVDLWENNHSRFLQSTTWAPIRIYIDYTTLDSQKALVDEVYVNNLKYVLSQVVQALQSLVKVKQSSFPLRIPICIDEVKVGDQVKSGVQQDLVIFPYIDTKAADTLEASASFCAQDALTGRPVAGFVGFNKNLDFTKKNAIFYQSLLVFHEVNHILAMNQSLFSEYIDANGKLIPVEKVQIERKINGVTRQLIATPKVVEAARKHFNCPTMEGVELENQGGTGTAGSHWEERVMAGDIMIGESYAENVISEITLAQMEDTGWYQVNYYTGGLFRFGKNQGCGFLTKKCVDNGQTKFGNEFAETSNSPMCFAGRTSKGVSSLQAGANPDNEEFKYFKDKTMGGQKLADFCPIATEEYWEGWYFNQNCWLGYSRLPATMGEKIGANSYCFISSLTPQNDNSVNSYKGMHRAICYDVVCNASDKTYTVNIGSVSVKCKTEGGAVTLNGFDGQMLCTDYNLICTKNGACGDTFDCISKKINSLGSVYNYTPVSNFQDPSKVTAATNGSPSNSPANSPTNNSDPSASPVPASATNTTSPAPANSSSSSYFYSTLAIFITLFFI